MKQQGLGLPRKPQASASPAVEDVQLRVAPQPEKQPAIVTGHLTARCRRQRTLGGHPAFGIQFYQAALPEKVQTVAPPEFQPALLTLQAPDQQHQRACHRQNQQLPAHRQWPGRSLQWQFPKVNLVLHEASPGEIVSMLRGGQADIGIATEALQDAPELAAFPYYSWHHGVVVPKGHALDSKEKLTLEALAESPLITYSEGFTGRSKIDKAFNQAGIAPDIVLSALDADVIKAYVELGLGIGIVASRAFDPVRDPQLRLIDADHLFEVNVSRVAVRRGTYLRGYAFRFIEHCSPKLTEQVVRAGIETPAE